ncbi:protein-L-isoaspartate(D-aspartate) O-methyltransferase [Halomicrobium urmianum]|uniref:protein-L-isoaspartate(D-aspartate) O-methyltransferase n=1 Tax=Halomicrobium urmianum TaxID=1586233 RepID=UPI001CD939D8|nr:protein-L-isoaspartate(D-aspartate) O-methyltransferase [Halomicrobium urmianum]
MDDAEAERACEDLVAHLRTAGEITSDRVAEAVGAVPRHEFVDDSDRERAYEDRPFDVGHDQVVTAPRLVARTSELLEVAPGDDVLEVGTGSGYHAAVLAELAGPEDVVTVERRPDLAERARRVLDRTGYGGVSVIVGDGSRGLPGVAPFDRISVAAAAPDVPSPLRDQLRDPGRLVLPLGPREGPHELALFEKRNGAFDRSRHGKAQYVPLIGAHGFDE